MPIQQMFLGAGGAVDTKTYVDDVFSTYLWAGNGTSGRTITNNIGVSGEGALVWIKNRTTSGQNVLTDTVRGANETIYSDSSNANYTHSNLLTAFTTTGFTVGNDSYVNGSGNDYTSWTFRKAPGFFDVVTYTGNGTAGRTVAHSLGSIPGCIMVKCTTDSRPWAVYHRGMGNEKAMALNSDSAQHNSTTYWNDTDPTASVFTVGTANDTNKNGETYVAYVFGNGCGNSVEFDATDDHLLTSSSSDFTFGTGDFTIEHWFKTGANHTGVVVDARMAGASYQTNFSTYITANTYRFFSQGLDRITSSTFALDTWHHVATVRNSGTTTIYLNGVSQGTYSDSNNYDNTTFTIGAFGPNTGSYEFNGHISNLKITKGQALYTSNFTPSKSPLTQNSQGSTASNVKLLCCNSNSSIIGTTVGSVTSGGNPTLTNNDPFGDSAANVFGENEDQNVIKCGNYEGNNSSTGPEINLGWEPSFLIIRNITDSGSWMIFDSMRGIATGGYDPSIKADDNGEEYASLDWLDLTPTGFKLKADNSHVNDNQTYLFLAIRRPDGYVGKPPSLGTGVFAMDTGNNGTTIPVFDSGFPVDFAFHRAIASTSTWFTGARLIQGKYITTDGDNGEASSANWVFDSNTGYSNDQKDSAWQSWMWKRHAGFDVVTFTGNGTAGHTLQHSLNAVPEMIWVKGRSVVERWIVGNKSLDGGTDPWTHYLSLNRTDFSEADSPMFNDTAPTATHFTLGSHDYVNKNNGTFIAILFSSVEGISKVGSYTGNGSATERTITLGFQPRLLIVKNTTSSGTYWGLLDTVRGWGSGNDERLHPNINNAQDGNSNYGQPTSNGFTLTTTDGEWNGNNQTYIYYAHA